MKHINPYRLFCERHYDEEKYIQNIADELYAKAKEQYENTVGTEYYHGFILASYWLPDKKNVCVVAEFRSDSEQNNMGRHEQNNIIIYVNIDPKKAFGSDKYTKRVKLVLAHEVRHFYDMLTHKSMRDLPRYKADSQNKEYFNSATEVPAWVTHHLAYYREIIDSLINSPGSDAGNITKNIIDFYIDDYPEVWKNYTVDTKKRFSKNIYRYVVDSIKAR